MFRYELKRKSDGRITHVKERDEDVANPWSKLPKGWNLEGNFEIVKTDVTAKNAARAAKKTKRNTARALLKGTDLTTITNPVLRALVELMQ